MINLRLIIIEKFLFWKFFLVFKFTIFNKILNWKTMLSYEFVEIKLVKCLCEMSVNGSLKKIVVDEM